MWNYSRENGHPLTIFDNIAEAPGHRAAVNILTKKTCQAIGIGPKSTLSDFGMGYE